jgi:hypothetical protein
MKLTYKRDEWGDYDVFNGSQKVGEIYRSALANFWVVDTRLSLMDDSGVKDEGYTRLKDAKVALIRILDN